MRHLLTLCGLVIFLVGCQGPTGEPDPSSETQAGQIVPSLPAISELAGTPAPEIPPLPALDADEITMGKKVYEQYCAECHGDNLEGEADWQSQNEDDSYRAPPHDADGHTWHHGDKVLVESILLGGARFQNNIGGISKMPAFEDTLTDEEIGAVLTYIKSAWPEDIRNIQWEMTINEQNR